MRFSPIGILSFNRPAKLKEVLESLLLQSGANIEGRGIHLFQDGAVNKYSRIRYTEDHIVKECAAVFKSVFPSGTLHISEWNIGIFENYDRAESFFFEENDFDCAYFFEDDLVLSPVYLQMLDILKARAYNVGNIAYFAAYGDYYAPPTPTDPRFRQLIPLDHHWGFGLFAKHRAAIRQEIQPYIEIVMGTDYTRRDHRAIYALYEGLRSCPRGTSQDAAKARACAKLGYWRCNTAAAFARYTGDVGLHMNRELFDQIGFSRVTPLTEPLRNIDWPPRPEIAGYVEKQRILFHEIAVNEIDGLRKNLGRYLNPMRLCSRQDIQEAYRLLLGRPVEEDSLIQQHEGRTPVFVFVRSLVKSDEFRRIENKDPIFNRELLERLCTIEDIQIAYRLLMHREAEAAAVFDNHLGKTAVWALCQGLLESDECKKLWGRIAA
jgi:hypothetical protein